MSSHPHNCVKNIHVTSFSNFLSKVVDSNKGSCTTCSSACLSGEQSVHMRLLIRQVKTFDGTEDNKNNHFSCVAFVCCGDLASTH